MSNTIAEAIIGLVALLCAAIAGNSLKENEPTPFFLFGGIAFALYLATIII